MYRIYHAIKDVSYMNLKPGRMTPGIFAAKDGVLSYVLAQMLKSTIGVIFASAINSQVASLVHVDDDLLTHDARRIKQLAIHGIDQIMNVITRQALVNA